MSAPAVACQRLAFIDWMKCLGLALIVFGHVTSVLDQVVPPIYPKQLGVAFVLFVAGFSLARETRSSLHVVFNRLFEVFLYGLLCAALVSAISLTQSGRLALSNYLPFALGANVLFNEFPANPTTWFIGTYIHALVVWALVLRRVVVRPWMLACVLVAEVAIRALLMENAGQFVAYMALANWATVFLLGIYCGQQQAPSPAAVSPRLHWWIALGVLAIAWPVLWSAVAKEPLFPFMRLRLAMPALDVVATSGAVSCIYVAYTWLTYRATRGLPATAPVTFIAQNTLIVFIAHMPVFYLTAGPIAALTELVWLRIALRFAVCFFLLAAVSHLVRSITRPQWLREAVQSRWWRRGSSLAHSPALTDVPS